ncbi:MAG: sigma-70 family RNA polymerase sigma factor [Gemmatimonadetes bacterium]|nr:sigma-70 family RNA polymerase sigma factor [Gemmatimonadota bacterium]
MDLSDEELVARAREGDRPAFARLVERHSVSVYNLTLRMVGNREDAEEAAQDVFVRAYRSLDRFRGDSRFSTWLYRIAVNVSLSSARRSRRDLSTTSLSEPEDDEDGLPMQLPDPLADPAERFEQAEFRDHVRNMVAALPPIYSAVISMYHMQSLSYDEIAEALELPIGTVKARLFRARAALRKLIYRSIEPDTLS